MSSENVSLNIRFQFTFSTMTGPCRQHYFSNGSYYPPQVLLRRMPDYPHQGIKKATMSCMYHFVCVFFFPMFSQFDSLSVFLVSSLQPEGMNLFWWNFQEMIWFIFVSVIFHGFWISNFAYLHCSTFTVSILVFFSSNFNTMCFVVVQYLLLEISKVGW